MPIFKIDGPPLDMDTKRKMVKEITAVAKEAYGPRKIIIYINDHKAENVAMNGQLVADRPEGGPPSGD